IARIVDIYRARWTIEEYFKALKTGCDFESKQLESMTTLVNALAIYIPIAVDLLRLRNIARDEPTRPARDVVPAIVLRVLQQHALTKLSDDATCAQAMLAVARFGGHIVNNGPPGWQVLGRGYETVRLIADGFALAAGNRGGDPINP
ncbi:MAG: transposase, partial [Polyangiales bacterium]